VGESNCRNGGVHHDDALRGGGPVSSDIVDAEFPACRPITFSRFAFSRIFAVGLGGGTDREAVVIADDLGELLSLFLAEDWAGNRPSMPANP